MSTFAKKEDPDEMQQHNAAFHQGLYTVCNGKIDLQTKENNTFFELWPDNPRYVQWTKPTSLYETRRKNP